MGAIVFWTIIRTALIIPFLWIVGGYIEINYWWAFSLLAVYGVIIHPAIKQYHNFEEENKEVLHNTLCSSCKKFDKTAVICFKYDQHPTVDNIPCEGTDWEPMSDIDYKEKKYE